MLPQRMKKAITDNPKKLANLIDLVNLPSTLREFVGQSQISRLGCFKCVWFYIKTNNLQFPTCKYKPSSAAPACDIGYCLLTVR
ncbi:uncharacterized protein LOC114395631 [Glycine soja]|uniref:DM2 domain-containing protein n=1 Tax=Glycine soja TaxID=3848 RepID=A0A0B2RBX9_GLYSO|nr:uncharacterized protein LOC114395631 [Glycine soja]XP_028213263.1 uncharacterized protein LOC114395631 [Glycine soja]KHN30875.1 hypothetical protein glysoja_045269 [Glycine soja]RZB51303.1 hypothetical protein D0Y65_047929 [Glycine soja]